MNYVDDASVELSYLKECVAFDDAEGLDRLWRLVGGGVRRSGDEARVLLLLRGETSWTPTERRRGGGAD